MSAAAVTTGHAIIGSARLYYELRGNGPALLFIPGGTVDSSHFAEVANLLADEFLTVTYDRRGNGASPRPADWHATSVAEQADDAAGLIEIPALVGTSPDLARVSRTLGLAGIPITFLADPAAAGSPPYRAARRLADSCRSALTTIRP
ncbi:alpha/beta fold hydrolase [Actinopolymorpha rutila]|uniref:AB hydrolase-1 domain-containing protein n=1 Tax=Actinopolymorpha rutila TaxID=446787 RepID=A0A852ZF05_9ACTN|nr:alpha/beta fold hydrolase [Actinopolymorpha rutila]NYH90863.1 hypothetical protein [Actinopolymorpha rutila]